MSVVNGPAPIDILDILGDAQSRGCAFGTARQARISAYLTNWLDSLQAAGIPNPSAHVADMFRETDFMPAIRQHAPDLLEEVEGIATGSGQPLMLILATQLMDEEWAYRARTQLSGNIPQKCSSLAVADSENHMWLAQNMDVSRYTDGHQILVRTAPDGSVPGALIFTVGSMIGLMGVNTSAIGVCVNSLPQLPSAAQGLPVAFVIRKLLQTENLEAARRLVHSIPHATAQHYLIADAGRIASFEASAAGVLEYRSPNPTRVLHTNHPLAAQDEDVVMTAARVNSVARLNSLQGRLSEGEVSLDVIQAALSSCDDPEHPVSRGSSAGDSVSAAASNLGFTTGSMISRLQHAAGVVDSWVSAGPPDARGYTHVQLATSFR